MADKLIYPLVNGTRHDFSSIKMKFAIAGKNTVEMYVKSINYSRTRSRTQVRGNHPDPIATTRGTNEYKADCEMFLAEYRLLVAELGAGYGDVTFNVIVTYGENGFETVTDEIIGCHLDGDDSSNGAGTDPLVRKIDLNPLKILMCGIEDLELPLESPEF